jgi:N-acyl-D-amino-acid deacylase
MTHDMIIKNGSVLDGTGAEAIQADIAIDDGRISRIGDVNGAQAGRTIDASGKIVTPGFVDLHTHLDAQIGWEPKMTPSSYHGVTTVLAGNCGVTFAPVSKHNRRFLAEIMEAVEDISADAIMDGLPWDWTSYGEYLDTVESLNPTLNFCGMAGHSPIRLEAMGDKSMDEGVQATDEELEHICRLVRESLEQGAAGFSTSRFLSHKVPDGRNTPGTFSDEKEMTAIQRAIVEGGGKGALFQVAPDMQSRFDVELDMFRTGAEIGCQVLFSGGGGKTTRVPDFLAEQNAKGLRINTACHTRPSYTFFSLARLAPFKTPAWNDLMALPTLEDRVEALNSSELRDKLVKEGNEYGYSYNAEAQYLHPLGTGEVPDWDMDQKMSLQQIADREGEDPIRVYVNRLLQSEGREFFNYWGLARVPEYQWRYMQQPHCIPVLGDAGAHVGLFCDADSTTFLLSDLTRKRGIFTLPEAIYRITGKSAEILGLKERGELREGWHADINIIDYENLNCKQPYYVNDFPHNGGRVVTESTGIDATLVNGEIVIENGVFTGQRPGEVIRDFHRG